MKVNASMWLKIVHEHLDKGVPMTLLAEKYKVDLAKIKYRTKLYLMHGEKPFTDEQESRVYKNQGNHITHRPGRTRQTVGR